MIRMIIAAKSMPQLKLKLMEAADAIKTVEQVENDTINESYEHPQTEAVNTDPEAQTQHGSANTEVARLPEKMEVSGELDARGVAWNEEIHASSKAKTKEGNWRYKRNVDMKVAKRIEGDAQSSPAPQVPAVPKEIPAVVPESQVALPVFQQPQPVQAPVVAPPAAVSNPSITVAPAPLPPTPVQQPVHSLDTFKANLPMTLANLVQQKRLTQEYIQDLCKYFGVNAIYEVTKDDSKTKTLYDLLVQHKMIEAV